MRKKLYSTGCVVGACLSVFCAFNQDFVVGAAGLTAWLWLWNRAGDIPDMSDIDREWMEFSQKNS